MSAQPPLGMEWSDAMTLSMTVSMPDLFPTYMEPMETASNNVHASGLTFLPQGCPFLIKPDAELVGAHVSSAATGHGME